MNEGKTVLITGGGKGIGAAIARSSASAGYDIILNYRKSKAEAETLKAEIEAMGRRVTLLPFDISNREECTLALEGYLAENEAPWGIVLNAGKCQDNAFPAMDADDWDSVIHTNLDGFYNCLHPLIMPLCRKRRGRIVVISSISGIIGNRGQVNYSASKAGLIGATKALAMEVASRHITVNAIAPGIIETDMIRGIPEQEMLAAIPMKRFGKAEEVAALATFLLSEDAGYITRQVISINGGIA